MTSLSQFVSNNQNTILAGAAVITTAVVGLMIYDRYSDKGIIGRKNVRVANTKDVTVTITRKMENGKPVLTVLAKGKTDAGKAAEKQIQKEFVSSLKAAAAKMKVAEGKAKAKIKAAA